MITKTKTMTTITVIVEFITKYKNLLITAGAIILVAVIIAQCKRNTVLRKENARQSTTLTTPQIP